MNVRYRVLSHASIGGLQAEVNEHTLNEWELYGGLSFVAGQGFIQCVIRHIGSPTPVDPREGEPPDGPNLKAIKHPDTPKSPRNPQYRNAENEGA